MVFVKWEPPLLGEQTQTKQRKCTSKAAKNLCS